MTWNEKNRDLARRALALLEMIPLGDMWVELNGNSIAFQAFAQSDVKLIRAFFPGAIWRKSYDEFCKWWRYDTTFTGVAIGIYAVGEAPPTCKRVETTRLVKKTVPVTYEERIVEETVVSWDCGGKNDDVEVSAEAAGGSAEAGA